MTTVVGSGPLEFNDHGGRLQVVSLAALTVDKGVVKPAAAWVVNGLTAADIAVATTFAKLLGDSGMLLAATAPAVGPAMRVTAAAPIPANTTAQVAIGAVAPAADGDVTKATFAVTVTETSTWTGLKTTTLAATLADANALVALDTTVPAPAAPDKDPTAATFTAAPKAAVTDAAAVTLFTLVPRAGDSGGLVKVTTSDVDIVAHTFKLTAVWTKTVAAAKVATAATDLAALAYSVLFAPPRQDGPFKAPKSAATVTLTGGGATPPSDVIPG